MKYVLSFEFLGHFSVSLPAILDVLVILCTIAYTCNNQCKVTMHNSKPLVVGGQALIYGHRAPQS